MTCSVSFIVVELLGRKLSKDPPEGTHSPPLLGKVAYGYETWNLVFILSPTEARFATALTRTKAERRKVKNPGL